MINNLNNINIPSYSLLDPTGNITILAEMPADPVEKLRLPEIAKQLMDLEPSAEQVGFLSEGDRECDLSLTMAGGEFCGNATMSAAAVFLSRQPGVANGEIRHVTVRVSGADQPVPVEICRISERNYKGTVRMPDVESITMETLGFEGNTYTLPVMRFKGIAHIITEHTMEKALAERAVVKWCEDLRTDALGIMQIKLRAEDMSQDENTLIPLVYVRTAGTLYWESSCASGTTAAGAYLSKKLGQDIQVSFREPAGVLAITAKTDGELNLSGSVKILKPFL